MLTSSGLTQDLTPNRLYITTLAFCSFLPLVIGNIAPPTPYQPAHAPVPPHILVRSASHYQSWNKSGSASSDDVHVLCRTRSHDVNVSSLPGVSKHRQSSSRAVRQAMPIRWDRDPSHTRSTMLEGSRRPHGHFTTFYSSFLLFHICHQTFLTTYHSWNPSCHIPRNSGGCQNRSIHFCFHGSGRWGG